MEKQTQLEKAIEIWNSLEVDEANFNFSCGGDCMGDTELQFFDKSGNELELEKVDFLVNYFDEAIYKKVDFYVNSDGIYQGEAGVVTIKLEDGNDDFSYYKEAESEYREMVGSRVFYQLTQEEASYIISKIMTIHGDCDDLSYIYKNDCLISDEEEKIEKEVKEKILDFLRGYTPYISEGELADFFRFTTNEDEEVLSIDDEYKLRLLIDNETIVFRDSY